MNNSGQIQYFCFHRCVSVTPFLSASAPHTVRMWCLILLFLYLVNLSSCIIPRACVSNVTHSPAMCCPKPAGSEHPCGFPHRGICAPVQPYRSILTDKFKKLYPTDIRLRWPERVFKYMCKCQSVFFGPDCGECWFGYEGENCNKRVRRTRKDVMKLSSTEKRQFVEISMKLRQVRSDYVIPQLNVNELRWNGKYINVDPFEMLDYAHSVSGQPVLTLDTKRCAKLEAEMWNSAHFGAGFPFYHRYLLLWMEREYQKVAERHFGIKNFTLPYWDWTNSRVCDPCVDELIGSSTTKLDNLTQGYFVSEKSPFGSSRWKVLCQNEKTKKNICWPCKIDRSKPSRLVRKFTSLDFPTVEEVIELLKITSYTNPKDHCDSFEDMMEAGWACTCRWKSRNIMLHTTVHDFIKGTLDILGSTMFDPIFLLHHVQVDRLFERWRRGVLPSQRSFHQFGRTPLQCRDCYMPVFLPPVKYRDMFVDARELGYDFENYDFGSLSEKIKIADWRNVYHRKTCPKWTLKSSRLINKNSQTLLWLLNSTHKG